METSNGMGLETSNGMGLQPTNAIERQKRTASGYLVGASNHTHCNVSNLHGATM